MSTVRNTDGTYSLTKTVTISALELYLSIQAFSQEVSQIDMNQLKIDAGLATATPPPVITPPTTPTGFRGIFAFNTGNAATFAANPSVAGTCLMRYWAEVNPTQGQYNWDLMDADMKPWIDAGKQVIWRISTSGWKNWQPAQHSQQGTPQWVLDLGVPHVTDDDGSVKPQYWNKTFLDNLQTFVQAFAARYDGNTNILAIEIGVGDGGETKPDTSKVSDALSKWKTIGYTDTLWWGAIQGIIQMYVESFTKTPLILMPDASFLGGTNSYNEQLVTSYAAKYGVWLQWNGLVSGASLPGSFAGLKTPVVCEQLNAAGQNKRSLASDLQTAINLGAIAALVFTSDLQDPVNQSTLAKYAAMASK